MSAGAQGIPGADLHAEIADDAAGPVDFPLFIRFAYIDGACRASPAAQAAEITFIDIDFDITAGIGIEFILDDRVHSCGRFAEQTLHDGFADYVKCHSLSPYLSVQLMQGSMVKARSGTSASSDPGSIFSRAGILAKVGVLTRNLSRYLVPLALA